MLIRKHRSQAQWQKIIQQQADSGLSVVAFCQQQDLLYRRCQLCTLPSNPETLKNPLLSEREYL